jgi:hypothetical protein
MKSKEFSQEELIALLDSVSGKSTEERKNVITELFKEKLPEGVYIVYGDTDESRLFSDCTLIDRKDVSGIAIKIDNPAGSGSYYLVRALKYEEDGEWQASMDLAVKKEVAGGAAFLPSPDQLFACFDKRDDMDKAAELLKSEAVDKFNLGWHWSSRAVVSEYAVAICMDDGNVDYLSRVNDLHALLFSAFKC